MVLKKNLVCIFVIMLIPNVPIHAQNIPYSANVGDKYYFKVSEFNFTSNVNSFLPLPASYILNTPFEIDVTSKNEGANTSQINYKLIYGNLNVDYSDPFMHVNTSIDNFIQIPLFWLNWQNNSQFAQYDVNSRQNETLTPYLLYISVEILTLFYKPFSLLEPFTLQVSINKSAGLTETILYQEQIANQTYSLKLERLNEFDLIQTYFNVKEGNIFQYKIIEATNSSTPDKKFNDSIHVGDVYNVTVIKIEQSNILCSIINLNDSRISNTNDSCQSYVIPIPLQTGDSGLYWSEFAKVKFGPSFFLTVQSKVEGDLYTMAILFSSINAQYTYNITNGVLTKVSLIQTDAFQNILANYTIKLITPETKITNVQSKGSVQASVSDFFAIGLICLSFLRIRKKK